MGNVRFLGRVTLHVTGQLFSRPLSVIVNQRSEKDEINVPMALSVFRDGSKKCAVSGAYYSCYDFCLQVSKKYFTRDRLQELLEIEESEPIGREQNADTDTVPSVWSPQSAGQEEMDISSAGDGGGEGEDGKQQSEQ